MAYDLKYNPLNLNYLPKIWGGTVTANDIAIQNRPFSLGQHLGPTPEQAAQQELENWFRANNLDPNQYYDYAAMSAPPQPGYNPAGGLVNTGQPLKKQQEIFRNLDGSVRTPEQVKAQWQAMKQMDKAAIPFDRKAALEAFKARQAALPANTVGPPINALALNAAMMANATVNGPNMLQTTYAPAAPASAPTMAPSQDSAAPKTFLPPYLQPGAPTDANNITGAKLPVATQIASPTPIAPPVTPFTPLMPQGFATPRPVTPGLFPTMAGVPRAGGFGGGFGATAKLLELPYYLRNFGGINYGR